MLNHKKIEGSSANLDAPEKAEEEAGKEEEEGKVDEEAKAEEKSKKPKEKEAKKKKKGEKSTEGSEASKKTKASPKEKKKKGKEKKDRKSVSSTKSDKKSKKSVTMDVSQMEVDDSKKDLAASESTKLSISQSRDLHKESRKRVSVNKKSEVGQKQPKKRKKTKDDLGSDSGRRRSKDSISSIKKGQKRRGSTISDMSEISLRMRQQSISSRASSMRRSSMFSMDSSSSTFSSSEEEVVKKRGKKKKDKKKKTEADVEKKKEEDEDKPKKDDKKKCPAKRGEGDQKKVKLTEPEEEAKEEAPKKKKKGKSKKILKFYKLVGKEPKVVESATKEKQPKKGKKKRKGKKEKGETLSAKERSKRDEERKLMAEQEAIRLAEEERIRAIEEKKEAIATEKREVIEQSLREEQLQQSLEFRDSIIRAGHDSFMADKIQSDWEDYLRCDGLPKCWNPADMNTYLHIWEKTLKTAGIKDAARRTDEIIKLLDDLEDLINDPFDETVSRQQDWKWIREEFRDYQRESLEYATYHLLRYIGNRMNRIDIPTADYLLSNSNFGYCLWTLVKLPTPTPNPRIPGRSRLELDWPYMSAEILFPHSLLFDNLAVRGMYAKYDHLSDTAGSYDPPENPNFYIQELNDCTAKEWLLKVHYKYDKRVIVKKELEEVVQEDGTVVMVEPEPDPEIPPDQMPPVVPWQKLEPSASEYALAIEKEVFDQKSILPFEHDESVLNMRKFCILGGVYFLDLFVQPPQPQEMVSFEIFISNLIIPCCIEEAHFYVGYTPPPPTDPDVRKEPEEIEEEMIRTERELDELIFINLKLPSHVYWFEAPVVCQWDQELKVWTTRDIHDFKFFEDKGYMTFRTGKFGAFALANFKYPNLPFQAWEIRPEDDGSVTFQLMAAILVVEFNVKGYFICISQMQNEPNDAMQVHIGKYYKLPKLISIMKSYGVDLFPDCDTFQFVEGTCEKHYPMERHLYYALAFGSVCYNFSWSRWNVTLDYRKVAFQMRLYKFNKPKQLNYTLAMVTPLKAVQIDCTEVSQTFSEEPVENCKFYPDMFFLIRGVSNMATKNKLQAAPLNMINSLSNLFMATRFLSFS
ncbi:PREDICTED: protein CASC1-like [Nicrophorus vespilloides]|uniref:Protein CASC1-like n=1 Tax=Nicrophorus vespilloides TaxID=110193 RepID=A0ABM1MXL3_NICVS|nr:PREDICTED: protein CASC1-like [Nicrophorus vespilloides]